MTKNKNSTRYYSDIQESRVANLLGGKKVANSGACLFSNSDVIIPGIMAIECKTKTKESKSINLKKEWLDTNEYERVSNKLPYGSLAISFTPEADENYFVINEDAMKKFIELLRMEQEMEAEQI